MEDYLKLGLSRRDALKAGAALAATAAIAPGFPGTAFAQAQTPKRGGHFKMGAPQISTNDSLDPTTYVSTYLLLAGYTWGNTLFTVDQNMKLVPEIAESAEPNADGTKWVVKIRRGVTYHNGKSVTAADVVWSINRHRAPEAASGMRTILDQIADMKATGSHEVTFELKAGNADWPYVLSDYHTIIQPEGGPTNTGIGTGPYMVDKFEQGVRLLGKRNPNYFRTDAAYFDTIEYVGINDPTARVSALQTGAVDLAIAVPPPVVSLVQRAGFTIHRGPSTQFSEFVFHSKVAPFDNVDLRLALKYAIDRKELVEKVFFGNGVIGNDHPIPSYFRFHAKDLPQKTYDPDKAKFHWQKSGFSGSLPPLTIASILFAGSGLAAAELFQQHTQKAGIKIDIERVPDDGFWANVWNKRPFFGSGWFGRPTEDVMLTQAYNSKSGFNAYQIQSDKIDQMLLAARSELNEAKRRQIYVDIQTIVSMDAGPIIPYFFVNLVGSSKKIQGFAQNPLGDGKFIERVFAA